MSAEWGTLRESLLSSPDPEEPSRAEVRAGRSSPAGWDEDLGRYGSDPWKLPGFGESGPKCGVWYPDSVCSGCGHVDLNTHKCGRRTCPDCWAMWAKEAGVRAAVRVQSFRYGRDFKQVAHAVVSPTEGDVMTEREFYNGKSKAAEIAQEKGFRGCAVVAHPWRVTERGKKLYNALDRDVGIWVWLRRNYTEQEIQELTYWSPHYHIIGPTTPDMDPADESDEWLYTFFRSVKPMGGASDKEAHEDVYGLFRYLLSHTGWPEDETKQVITWYGDLANAVFVEDATEDWQIQKPSEGVRNSIRRHTEEVAGVTVDEDGGDGVDLEDTDDKGSCPCDDCDGVLIDVLDVADYLRHNQPPPDVCEIMETCYDWRLGRISPPAGMKLPRSEEEAVEVLQYLTGDVGSIST